MFAASCAARVVFAQGTSLLPDSAVVPAIHGTAGAWSIMAHGSVMLMHDRQWTLHGGRTSGLVDWEMLSASRDAAGGTLRLTAMTSLESLVLPDTGYVQLLQTGETFGSRRIANVQHSHDIISELSAYYGRTLFGYVAVIGEPAIGPVSFHHRPSASTDPFGPLGHHAQDASHTSFGVLTAGVRTRSIQIEASAFNAREPTNDRSSPSFDGARLDSYSTRVTFLPTPRIALAGWMGYLADHDPLDSGLGMQRFGASMLGEFGPLSTAVIWGMNNHHHGSRAHDHESTTPATHHLASSVLAEATLALGRRTEVFGRAEQVQKTADELGFLAGNLMETFNVRALSIGATRQLASVRSLAVGVGGRFAVNFLPQTLDYTYTTTHPAGFAVYLRVIPGRGSAAHHH